MNWIIWIFCLIIFNAITALPLNWQGGPPRPLSDDTMDSDPLPFDNILPEPRDLFVEVKSNGGDVSAVASQIMSNKEYQENRLVPQREYQPNEITQQREYEPNEVMQQREYEPNEIMQQREYEPNQVMQQKEYDPNQIMQQSEYEPNQIIQQREYEPNQIMQQGEYQPNQAIKHKEYQPNNIIQARNYQQNRLIQEKEHQPKKKLARITEVKPKKVLMYPTEQENQHLPVNSAQYPHPNHPQQSQIPQLEPYIDPQSAANYYPQPQIASPSQPPRPQSPSNEILPLACVEKYLQFFQMLQPLISYLQYFYPYPNYNTGFKGSPSQISPNMAMPPPSFNNNRLKPRLLRSDESKKSWIQKLFTILPKHSFSRFLQYRSPQSGPLMAILRRNIHSTPKKQHMGNT